MRRTAFTLVELLIVVIILGILAAVVVPQFSDAGEDAKLSSLTTNLQTIRGQIELYKIQHGGNYPDFATFSDQMTAGTDVDGNAGPDFGPYLQTIPNNPFNNLNDLAIALDGLTGWYYNALTGEFRANDGAHDAL
jgi:general secretion pathway protein G